VKKLGRQKQAVAPVDEAQRNFIKVQIASLIANPKVATSSNLSIDLVEFEALNYSSKLPKICEDPGFRCAFEGQ